ncbi:MAG: helix-turn-helix transcriptional regulator [Bacteroidota bacterium]
MKNRVREERHINNLTQASLAEIVSVSRQTIISIESYRYIPSTILSLKLAKVFNKKVEEMFILEETD